MEKELRHDLSTLGMILLILLMSDNLLRMPFLMVRRMFFFLNGFGFSPFAGELIRTLIYTGSMVVTIFFGVWLLRCGRPFLFPLATPRSDYLVPALGAGLGVGMVGNLTAMLLTSALALVGVQSVENAPSFEGGLLTVLLTLFSTMVLPAVLEELLFRGVLLQPLRKYGDRVAVVVSAVLFALCHSTLPQFINALLVGLCLGVFAVRSGSLITSMAVHLAYNGVACAVTLLTTYYPTSGVILLSWLMIFSLIVLGIYAIWVLRRRFGSAWWLSPAAAIPVRSGQVLVAALCSVPLWAAVFFYLATIVHNLYW